MARDRSISLSPSVSYLPPRGWSELPARADAVEGEASMAWARAYLLAMDEAVELELDAEATTPSERFLYPLNGIYEELSELAEAAEGGRLHVFGCGSAMARLFVFLPEEALEEQAREEAIGRVMQWAGTRFSGTGLLGPREDLEYFEVDVENDLEAGSAVTLLWPGHRVFAHVRAQDDDDARAALSGVALAGYRVDIRKALDGE